MGSSKPPPAPRGSGTRARALWQDVVAAYHLDEHEVAVLTECARTLDTLDALADVVRREGVMGPDGKVHPAVVESRQARITLTRLLASLRLPDDVEARPQRRGAARGAYRVVG